MPNKNDAGNDTGPTRRAPGRPRKFDEGAVLLAAQQVFLDEGYEAVSYEKIGAVTGLSKPSLYNSFGDKAALFARVLQNYGALAHAAIVASVENNDSLAEAARSLLDNAAIIYSRPDDLSVGCLMIGTSLPACATDDSIQTILTDFVAGLDKAIADVLDRDYARELNQHNKSGADMAALFTSLLFALAIRARTGLTQDQLQATARDLARSTML